MSVLSATSAVLSTAKNNLPPELVVFGRSAPMLAVQQKLEKVASANVPILIQGESGTGKEIITKLVHHLSPWSAGPLVSEQLTFNQRARDRRTVYFYERPGAPPEKRSSRCWCTTFTPGR